MSAFDVLERQLRDSARPRRRRRRGLWLAPAIAAAAAALLVLHEPAPNDERAATPPVATWTPVLGDHRRGHASISRTPVPPEQLKALAVLRRPPRAADRSPAVRELLRYLGGEPLAGVRVDAVRLLAQHGRLSTILVPAERMIGRFARRDVLCIVQTTVVRGNPPPGSPPAGSISGAGSTCGTLASFREHGYIGFTIPAFGLVPDGVASVRVRVRGGRTITTPVRNNAYDAGDSVFPIQPPVWLDVNGHVIRRP